MKKKVSIIVPCYNVDKYIEECLNSILCQTYGLDAIRIIVIDDASTDSTPFILRGYEERYSENIVFIPLDEHLGLPGLIRNIALDYASGEYLMFVDADDYIQKDCIDILIKSIMDNACDSVSCGYTIFSENVDTQQDCLGSKMYEMYSEQVRRQLICNEGTRTSVWARMYRKDFVEEHHIRFAEDYHIAEDMFFWHQCMFYADRSVSIEDCLYNYRIKSNSIFHSKKQNHALDLVHCIGDLSEMFQNIPGVAACEEEYGAVLFKKCGFELLGYLDTHETSDEMFATVISQLRRTLMQYWINLPENKYLSGEEKELARKLIG